MTATLATAKSTWTPAGHRSTTLDINDYFSIVDDQIF
jgi:hypothetical protein